MSFKNILRRFALVVVGLFAIGIAMSFIWPPINDVQTGATPQYPDLRPQKFDRPYDRVFDEALATAQAEGWEITLQDRQQGEIRAVATTTLLRFKDDVTVILARVEQGTTVNVRSRSRIGKSDLGANARRIRRFQSALAERMAMSGKN